MIRPPPSSPLFPYTTLSRSPGPERQARQDGGQVHADDDPAGGGEQRGPGSARHRGRTRDQPDEREVERARRDRKSTRLNSSHSQISYAVFCLKKKKKQKHKD